MGQKGLTKEASESSLWMSWGKWVRTMPSWKGHQLRSLQASFGSHGLLGLSGP